MNLNEIFAFRIKLKFTKAEVDELALITTQKKVKPKLVNTKEYFHYRLKQFATMKRKPLNIVLISVGQNFKKDNEFMSLRNLTNEDGFNFFYADAAAFLNDLTFKGTYRNIVKEIQSNMTVLK